MITAEMEVEVDEIETDEDGVPYSDSVYPQEVIDMWDRDSELLELKIESGEVEYKSVREVAAEFGVILD